MTTPDDRHDDVWAQAVAEGADAAPITGAQPAPDASPAADAAPAAATPAADGSPSLEKPTAGTVEDRPAGQPAAPADLFGPELAPLVDEVRKFATTVGEKITAAQNSVSNGDTLGAMQDLASPLRVKYPEVYGHLIAAGGELLAAYRSAVSASEKRWAAEKRSSSEHIDLD
ncbi:DUF5304 family protein [Streptacidiphilus sp. EB129]|uniref:DUF5304 family protein n=1 Tax=Streptacidiphilus sp. EB129 TaxID=3156262 RepID=UPI0035145E48